MAGGWKGRREYGSNQTGPGAAIAVPIVKAVPKIGGARRPARSFSFPECRSPYTGREAREAGGRPGARRKGRDERAEVQLGGGDPRASVGGTGILRDLGLYRALYPPLYSVATVPRSETTKQEGFTRFRRGWRGGRGTKNRKTVRRGRTDFTFPTNSITWFSIKSKQKTG